MFNELDVVVLKADVPEFHLAEGDMGTIVYVHDNNAAYEVEFVATDGSTIAVITLLPLQIRLASEKREIFHVRRVA